MIFDARRRLHATEPWTGEPRLVIITWTVIHFNTLDAPIKSELRERRFPLPGDESPRVFECSLLTPSNLLLAPATLTPTRIPTSVALSSKLCFARHPQYQ